MKRNITRFMKIILIFNLLISAAFAENKQPFPITILGINDFHGQISAERKVNGRPVGGAAVMAAYLKNNQKKLPPDTLLALMGDQVGASTPASGLLNHEPTILFFNTLGNKFCRFADRMNPHCNLVATIGNHEFDRGLPQTFKLLYGSHDAPTKNWIDLPNYPGATFPFISTNILYKKTGKTIFPPFIIKKIHGIRIAFIGAITGNAAAAILPSNLTDIKFIDPAEAINAAIPQVKALGANVIVVIIHEGGNQVPYEGSTQEMASPVTGPIVDVINKLDDSVDVVMAGHTHQFINAFLPNQHGKKILVTQANSYSTDFAKVTLLINPYTKSVINESAEIIKTYADQGAGTSPDLAASHIVKLAEDTVAPLVNIQIGVLQNDLTKPINGNGEAALGNLVADGSRAAMQTDIAFINPGNIRADLYTGSVTWANLYAVEPFGNTLIKTALTGQQLYDLLEQQWRVNDTIFLQISGFSYKYDLTQPLGHRIVEIDLNNQPIDRAHQYTITTNNFLFGGGDGFTVFQQGQLLAEGGTDLDTLINYIKSLPQPFTAKIEGRIQKING